MKFSNEEIISTLSFFVPAYLCALLARIFGGIRFVDGFILSVSALLLGMVIRWFFDSLKIVKELDSIEKEVTDKVTKPKREEKKRKFWQK